MSAADITRFGFIIGGTYVLISEPVRAIFTPLPPATTNGAILRPPFLYSISTMFVGKEIAVGKNVSISKVVGLWALSIAPNMVRVSL
ncbi:hypothetical protein SDC9_167795 [bioreactor metagenome]|uniref:Uncharacterized protein n=1 Tax=bioreactor metagenome TaxID=1076179 RepID=A0A645G2N9_9ZZZZ